MKGIIKVVTVGGKTFFALICFMKFLRRYPNGQVYIIVPTLTLLDQWILSLQENLFLKHDQISEYSGEKKAMNTNLINVFVINTARTEITKTKNADRPNFLIVDECHRAASKENSKAIIGGLGA